MELQEGDRVLELVEELVDDHERGKNKGRPDEQQAARYQANLHAPPFPRLGRRASGRADAGFLTPIGDTLTTFVAWICDKRLRLATSEIRENCWRSGA